MAARDKRMAAFPQQYGRYPPRVTAANAPLWQARPRLSAKREMTDAYFGAPGFEDANLGYGLTMKIKAYKNRLAVAYAKKMGMGAYGRRMYRRFRRRTR